MLLIDPFSLTHLLTHRPFVTVGALALGIGATTYYFVIKWRAAASLRKLLAERFTACERPVVDIVVPARGRVHFYAAYTDTISGMVLILGNWYRGIVPVPHIMNAIVSDHVAGLFHHGVTSISSNAPSTILETTIEGGALVIWKGIPSRESVLAHLEALSKVKKI